MRQARGRGRGRGCGRGRGRGRAVVLAVAALLALGAAACGEDAAGEHDSAPDTDVASDSDAATDVDPDTRADDTAVEADTVEPATPRMHFFVDERPHDDRDSEVDATAARWGDPIRVVVDGLAPGAEAMLAFQSAAGQSQALFVADANGVVDLARDAPLSGDWSQAHVDAFLWFMKGEPPEFDPAITGWAFVDGAQVANATLARHSLAADIVVEAVAEGTARGVFALPPGEGPFGGVLCFGGSEGSTSSGERCSRYFANLGYAALGVGYFGAEGLPANLAEVPLEILEGDLARLTADPRVAPGGIVVIGGSRGGELALLLGAYFPAVAGVVAQVPSGYVWPSLQGDDAAWTYQGGPLAFIPKSDTLPEALVSSEGLRGLSLRDTFLADIAAATEQQRADATIAIEHIDGPVLLLGGDDDQLWPSCLLADIAWQRLVSSGHTTAHDDRNICAPDAGHFATGTPGWSAVGSTAYYFAAYGFTSIVGGTVAGNGAAWRSNDTLVRRLLEDVLGPGKIVPPSSPSP